MGSDRVIEGTTTERLAVEVVAACRDRQLTLAVAESCTGGQVAAVLTSIPGASRSFWGGAVVYTPAAKCALAGLDPAEVDAAGVVSATTTGRLAEGIRGVSGADVGLAVTGWAGPDSEGSDPIGSVYLAIASGEGTRVEPCRFAGCRAEVRNAATVALLTLALESIDAIEPDSR